MSIELYLGGMKQEFTICVTVTENRTLIWQTFNVSNLNQVENVCAFLPNKNLFTAGNSKELPTRDKICDFANKQCI